MKISKILLSVAVAFSLGNAKNLDSEKAKTIENLKNQIVMFEKLGAKGIVELKNQKLEILEGKVKVENEGYGLAQIEKEIYDSFFYGFMTSVQNKDYKDFGDLLDIYKIENNGMGNEILDNLIETKDLEFFKILKDKGYDKLKVYGVTEENFLDYLIKNKADKEIIKIFK